MTIMPLGRRTFLGSALPLGLAACSSSPDPALYTIQMKPGPVLPGGPKIVQVRDVSLASYLDRKEIVRSSQDYKLAVMSNDWWGESLAPMLGRVIAMGLAQRLPESRVLAEGGAIPADYNAVVGVNIQRLDLDGAGTLQLLAQAGVEFNRPRKMTSQTFQISRTPSAATTAGQVAAISEAVAEMTNGIAGMLQA
jgi:uncharacterized lipoprotein YmbA